MNDIQSNKINLNDTRGKSSFWKTFLKYIVPPIITVALCWILFTGVDIKDMWTIISTQCDFRWIALGLLISIFSHVFRAMRWQIQLYALDVRPPLFITVLSIFGTYAVNLVLPRLGEFWRTGYIAERQKASFTEVFGSMVCDRLADTVVVFLLLGATLFLARDQVIDYLSQDPAMYDRMTALVTSPWIWAAIILMILAIWAIFRFYPQSKSVRIVKNLAAGIWQGFIVILKMRGKGRWLLFTFLIWFSYFIQLYVAFLAFPATSKVISDYGFTAVLVCFVLSSLAMAVPSNGGIGPYQWALIFGLGMYSAGIPELTLDYSTSVANLILGANTILLILLGIFTFIYITVDKRRNTH